MTTTASTSDGTAAADLEKALLSQLKETVKGVQRAQKKGYIRLHVGRNTIAYVKPRKKGGLTIDVPKGSGAYDKITVEKPGQIGSAATKIAAAVKEPAAAAAAA